MSEANFVYLTRERLVELEKELKELKTNGRKEIAEKIATARAHGDLSENAEYDAAKEEQGLFELNIYWFPLKKLISRQERSLLLHPLVNRLWVKRKEML